MSKTNKSKPAPIAAVAIPPRTPDPRIVEILAAFDRAALCREEDCSGIFMERVCDFARENWPAGRSRVMLATFLDLCADGEIDEALEAARGAVAWVVEFELQEEFERATGLSCYNDAFTAWRDARVAA